MAATGTDICVVTGAAGSIGQATVGAFGARGWSVVAVDVRPLPSDAPSVVVRVVQVDLTRDECAAEHLSAIAELGPVRHVVAIAGGGDAEELSQADPAVEAVRIFERVVAKNLYSAFITIRHTVPMLRRSTGDRSITVVGSINAFGGYGAPGYSSAKAGLSGLVTSLAKPLGGDGIRINCLALGTVDTENLHRLAAANGRNLDLAAVGAAAPLGRVLTPREVGQALAAMSLDMPGLTGSTVVLDNGQTLIR